MPTTYEPIATTTLGNSTTRDFGFSSIPSIYTDLRVVIVGRITGITASNIQTRLRMNSDSGSNYSNTLLQGNGSTISSSRETSVTSAAFGNFPATASTDLVGLATIDIFNYAGSTFKTFLGTMSDDANGSGLVERNVGLWRSTSAITSIDFSVNFSIGWYWYTGTTATLYGIKAA
jgi:hypothetical protein